MSTIRRDFKASPQRTGSETWRAICNLIAPKEGASRRELLSVEGIAGQLIASESIKDYPIIVVGTGPRLRIYCLYDDDALEEDNANESTLAANPTEKETWKVSIPALSEDVNWSGTELKEFSSRITVREMAEDFDTDKTASKSESSSLELDTSTFLKL